MGNGFSEAPLAVFTTLAPMGACAFIVLALCFAQLKLDDERIAKLDKMTFVPVVIMLAGFVGAFFHLANPAAALGAVAGIGRSPLTNEVAVGGIMLVAAIVYWVLAVTGKLGDGARKAFAWALAVWSVVFAAFCGLAYLVSTVPSWNTPWTVVQMVGYGLLGGSAVGALTLRLAGVEGVGRRVAALGLAGLVISLVGFGGQIALCGEVANIWGSAASLVPAIWALFAVLAVCGAVAVAIEFAGGRRSLSAGVASVACVAVAVGVFFARIGFYGLFMSVAL